MGLNGVAMSGFLEGRRMAEQDSRTQQAHDMQQKQLESAYQFDQQANPYRLGALALANQLNQQTYDFNSEANPYRVKALEWAEKQAAQNYNFNQDLHPLEVAGKRIANRYNTAQASRFEQMTPWEILKLQRENDESKQRYDHSEALYPVELEGKRIANKYNTALADRYQQETPFKVGQSALDYEYQRDTDPLKVTQAQLKTGEAGIDYRVKKHGEPLALAENSYKTGAAGLAFADVQRAEQNKQDLQVLQNFVITQGMHPQSVQSLEQMLSKRFNDDVKIERAAKTGEFIVKANGGIKSLGRLADLEKTLSSALGVKPVVTPAANIVQRPSVTAEDIRYTAQKYGISEETLKQQLGFQ